MFKFVVIGVITLGLALPIIQTDKNPTETIPQDLSFVYATQIQQPQTPPSLATLMDDSVYYSIYDPSSPTEAVIGVQVITFSNLKVETTGNTLKGQCVWYVSEIKKLPIPKGNANQIKPNSKIPVIGGAILFWGGKYGHIAFVENMTDTTLYLSEMNLVGLGVISTRSIELTDPRIKGFLK